MCKQNKQYYIPEGIGVLHADIIITNPNKYCIITSIKAIAFTIKYSNL